MLYFLQIMLNFKVIFLMMYWKTSLVSLISIVSTFPEMMRESKLTNFQQRKIQQTLKGKQKFVV